MKRIYKKIKNISIDKMLLNILVKNGCINLLKIKAKIKSLKNMQKKHFFKSKIKNISIDKMLLKNY